MCALAVPKIESKIIDTPSCIYKKDLNSIILGSASNSRFTQDQLERCANVDWITIYQDHNDKKGKLRKIDGGVILNLEDLSNLSEETFDSYLKHSNPIKIVPFKEDEENKELTEEVAYKELWCTHKKFLAEGSHNTRIMLFCDGTRVFLSGNVGRWGRKDNLFNLNFQQTISKCNSILKKYDLPPFTIGKSERFFSQFDGKSHLKRLYGAVVTRLDINVNFATGSPENAQYLIDYLQARSMSYVSKSVSGRSSVQWGKKGGRLYTKAYVKFEEMLRHCSSKKDELAVLTESFAYQFAKNNGIVRIETEIDRKTLSETGLRDLENITMSKLVGVAKIKIDELMNDIPLGLEHFEPEKVFYKKEHKKYIKTLAMWKSGMDLKAFTVISKSTFYRHKEEILKISGIDIEQRYVEGVTVEALSLISKISLEPVERPENYSLAIDWEAPELNVIDLTRHLPTRKQINEALLAVVPTQEFLNTNLAEPNHALIAKRNAEAKERYQMRKLYDIKNQDKRAY
ncbi:phage/plasmid replication domain-containing protein [Wohlfahrtiimonas larvae]|uniref:Uncharacterized protein n=1 Tax=Wohlfahrtiimonas larvae TaxID=1157986 RepID=A0ABP9MKS1_9GAMM|nr:phage/plasmid replication protein [Wohlfahrtiimonas larvae]